MWCIMLCNKVIKPSIPLYDVYNNIMSITMVCVLIFFYVHADAISETNPRVIDDTRARKLAADLKRCSYYETCATYGLNVDRVFQDGKKIIIILILGEGLIIWFK